MAILFSLQQPVSIFLVKGLYITYLMHAVAVVFWPTAGMALPPRLSQVGRCVPQWSGCK